MAKQRPASEIFAEILGRNWFDTPDFSTLAQTQPTRSAELANYLSTHSRGGRSTTMPAASDWGSQADKEEPSAINKFFDWVSAPLYTVGNTVSDIFDDPNPEHDQWWEKTIDFGEVGKNVAGGLARLSRPLTKPATMIPGVGDKVDKAYDDFIQENNAPVMGHNILENAGVENKFAKYGGGFALDLAMDPLSYVPVIGWGKKAQDAGKALEAAAATGKSADAFIKPQTPKPITAPVANEAITGNVRPKFDFPEIQAPVARETGPNPATRQGSEEIAYNILNDPVSLQGMLGMKRSDDARRAANIRWGNPEDAVKTPRALTISEKAQAVDDMRAGRLAKAGKVTDGKGNISNIGVAKTIESIERGEIPRFGPPISAATGPARNSAVRIMDEHINRVMGKSRVDHNPANQANLHSSLRNEAVRMFQTEPSLIAKFGNKKGVVNVNAPRTRAAINEVTLAMLRSAEDHGIRLGAHPVYWDGTRVRLSDILAEVGPTANDELLTRVVNAWQTKNLSKIKEPEVANAIYTALARRPLHMSHLLEDLSQKAQTAKDSVLSGYSYPKAQEALGELPEYLANMGKNAGMTDAEVNAVKDLVRNVIDVDKLPHEKFIALVGGKMREAVANGRLDAETLHKYNQSITKILGQTKRDLMTDISGNKVVDGFMLRFSTAYGRIPEMKVFSDDVFTWGEMNAVARATWLRNMVSGASREEVIKGFKIAQGMLPKTEAFSQAERSLADKFEDYFQTMLGSSGLSDLRQGNTVAVKSQIVMDDVNRQLKAIGSNFQFQNGSRVIDNLGVPQDYSEKGIGWLDSWKLADPKKHKQDPISFLWDMDLAIERTVKEYAVLDEFARTFGVRKGDELFNKAVHTERLRSNRIPDDIFFQKEHRDAMHRLMNDLESGLWKPNSKLIQHYSRGLRAWKTGVTIYMPSHHIRNMIGDLHLMWWAGHNDPRNFFKARRVMHSQRSKYKDALHQDTLDTLKGLIDKDAMEWAATRGGDVIIRQNGIELTADQLYISAHQHGLLLDANKYEDIFGEAPLENIGKQGSALQKAISRPLGGKAHQAAATVAEYREHYIRLSHYIGAVNKGLKKSKDLQKVLDDAAHEVRKWHPDGRDLTKFEQKTRMAIPFYSWTRKALPLIVQSAVTRPAKVLYYPKATGAMAGMMGIESENMMLDPFPNDQLFPEWIRAKGIGPLADPESQNLVSSWWGKLGRNEIGFHGQERGYTMLNPSNPFHDVWEQLFGFGGSPMEIGKGIFDSSTPAIKVPGELTFDQKFSGAPIQRKEGGDGVLSYLAEQVPILSAGLNVAEIGKEDKPGRENGMDTQALINYLTALGLRGTGPYQTSAEIELGTRLKNQ